MITLVVGDVHGCAEELQALFELADPDRVVLVGDVFTKGPDPVGVWRLIRETPMVGVLGNHEQRLLDIVEGGRPHDEDGRRCIERLNAYDPAWLPWVRSLPLYREVGSWTVVHAALHPTGLLEDTTPHIATRLRRWPEDAADDPHWWEVYTGRRRVVFGHDARRGFVMKKRFGVPWVVGLDTGCVYGRALTGWIPEQERVLQVPAQRVYCDYRANGRKPRRSKAGV